MSMKNSRRTWLAGVAWMTMAVACAKTQQVAVQQQGMCGLLGPQCSKLTAGLPDQFQLRYVNPSVQWTTYNQVEIEPVTFWGPAESSVSPSDQQRLADYFNQEIRTEFGKHYQLVDQAGPGVMVLQIALTDVSGATPGLRTIASVVPQARALSTLKYLATGTYAFVGSAQVEGKLTDSQSGKLLAAIVDRRVGGGSLEAAAQWKWGDVENAMNAWATKASNGVYSWTSGAASPS
jgi:hypothetical protein